MSVKWNVLYMRVCIHVRAHTHTHRFSCLSHLRMTDSRCLGFVILHLAFGCFESGPHGWAPKAGLLEPMHP